MSHFEKYWSKPLQADVLKLLEAKVRSSHIFRFLDFFTT
jgi:hypothetical protein